MALEALIKLVAEHHCEMKRIFSGDYPVERTMRLACTCGMTWTITLVEVKMASTPLRDWFRTPALRDKLTNLLTQGTVRLPTPEETGSI